MIEKDRLGGPRSTAEGLCEVLIELGHWQIDGIAGPRQLPPL